MVTPTIFIVTACACGGSIPQKARNSGYNMGISDYLHCECLRSLREVVGHDPHLHFSGTSLTRSSDLFCLHGVQIILLTNAQRVGCDPHLHLFWDFINSPRRICSIITEQKNNSAKARAGVRSFKKRGGTHSSAALREISLNFSRRAVSLNNDSNSEKRIVRIMLGVLENV